jgi:hypothetical protein
LERLESPQRLTDPIRKQNISAETETEEVTDRRLNPGIGSSFQYMRKHNLLQTIWLIGADREPDMRDDARPGQARDRSLLSCLDGFSQFPLSFCRGNALLRVVSLKGQGSQILRKGNPHSTSGADFAEIQLIIDKFARDVKRLTSWKARSGFTQLPRWQRKWGKY